MPRKITINNIPCPICKLPFSGRRRYRVVKYCSNECRIKGHTTGITLYEKICLWCDKLYSTKYNHSKFCSHSCSISSRNKNLIWSKKSRKKISKSHINSERYIGSKNPNYKGSSINFTCINCNNIFPVPKNHIDNKKHGGIFCSKRCYYDFKAKNKTPEVFSRLYRVFGGNISKSLKRGAKKSKWTELVGYDLSELKNHLEAGFKDGMSWSNYGFRGWHIDHKIPMSCFNFEYPYDKEFEKCWALSNLQPLWAHDNFVKGGKNTKKYKSKSLSDIEAEEKQKRELVCLTSGI